MKKEILIACFLGLLLGGVFVYGFYRSKAATEELALKRPITENRTVPSNQNTGGISASLQVNAPIDGQIFDSEIATISGTTIPNSTVVVYTKDADAFTKSDSLGYFTTELKLIAGQNDLTIHSLSKTDESDEVKLSVVFTTEL